MSEPDSDPASHAAAALARQMLVWLDEGRRVAWAVVMSGSNHALSPPGQTMAVVEDGAAAGSLSRGCIEDSVIRQALRAIEDGEQRILAYTVTDEVARREAGLGAGGGLELYLEPVDPGGRGHRLLERVVRTEAEGRPVALVSDLVTGMKTLVWPHAVHGSFGLDQTVLDAVRECLAAGRVAVLESGEDSRLLVQCFGPPLQAIGST